MRYRKGKVHKTVIPIGFCIAVLIFAVMIQNTAADNGTVGKGITYPIEADGRTVQIEAADYLTSCALSAAGTGENDSADFMEAVCTVINTNVWYLLQRMEAVPQTGFGMVWKEKEELIEQYGEDAWNAWYQAACQAEDRIVMYCGEPILAAYHYCGFGVTESAKSVWGEDLPYLTHIRSEDMSDTVNIKTYHYSWEQLNEVLENGIRVISRGESGRVQTVSFGDVVLSGSETVSLLGLSSEVFTVSNTAEGVKFVCIGMGNGIGLSITGARYLSEKGASAEEILQQYYPGTRVERLK